MHILLILNCFSPETENMENVLKEQTRMSSGHQESRKHKRNFTQGSTPFWPFRLRHVPEGDGSHGHSGQRNLTQTSQAQKIKILNTMNSHYSEHKFINGQSSQKVLLEMLFHRHHGSRNWQKTKLNISFPLSGDAAMISENQNWYVGLWIIFICIRNNVAWWRTPKPPHFSKNVFGSFPAYAVLLPFWE